MITYHEEYHEETHWGHTHTQGHGESHQHNNQQAQQHFHVLVLIPWRPVKFNVNFLSKRSQGGIICTGSVSIMNSCSTCDRNSWSGCLLESNFLMAAVCPPFRTP
jgi:hypothetical protein